MKRNKLVRSVLIIIIFSVFGTVHLSAQNAIVREVVGKVELRESGSGWTAAYSGLSVSRGTTISAGFNSAAVLDLGTSVVHVKALTRMTLRELIQQGGTARTDLYLDVGRVRADVRTTEGVRHDFTIRSPVSTASVRGTVIEGDGEEWLTESGTMVVSNNAGQSVTVSAGQETLITGNDAPVSPRDSFEVGASVSIQTNPTEGGGGGFSDLGPSVDTTITGITIEVEFEE